MLDLMVASAHSTVLVGRDADLATLHDAFRRAGGGEAPALLIGGEAGVGKTRLVEEFVRGLDARVLVGQCLELGEEGLPFAPFAAALRELARHEGGAVFAGREAEFARLLPELGSPPELGGSHRGHLFELVGALFARLGEQRPVVLVVEDLHWADRSTRDLIGFLVRSARVPRLLLVATYRTDELHRGHPLRPFLGELERVRGVHRHDLDRLDRDGTAELLGHLLGAEPDRPTVDAVCERAQGIPFFIEQFAASADPRCGDIPETLRDLLLARVDQLPEAAQRVLRVAAVGGTRFGHELLARVADVDDAALESALRSAVAAQMIVFDPDGGYEFRHALVREAVHDDLLPGERARLHAHYAQAIEAEPRLVAADRAPAEIAHHWFCARDHARALVAAGRAADAAGRRYAFAEQARLLERALELWEQVPDAAELLGKCHLDLLEEAALAAIDAGDHGRAGRLTRAALADLDGEAEPTRAARLLIRRAKLLRNAGKSDGAAEAREAYRLLQLAPPDLPWLKLLGDVAYVFSGIDGDEAGRIAAQVMACAGEFGDEAARIAAEITFGQVCSGHLPPEQSLPAVRRAIERARASGDIPNLAHGLVNISDTLYEVGAYAESAAAAAEGVPHADRVGVSRTTGVYLLANHAEALMALGRWDEADARLAEAARHDPPGTLVVPWLRLRARLRLARGHDGAEALVAQAAAYLAKPFLNPDLRLGLLELRIHAALAAGDPATARAAARVALRDRYFHHLPRYSWPLLAAAARALPASSFPAPPGGARALSASPLLEPPGGVRAVSASSLSASPGGARAVSAPPLSASPGGARAVSAPPLSASPGGARALPASPLSAPPGSGSFAAPGVMSTASWVVVNQAVPDGLAPGRGWSGAEHDHVPTATTQETAPDEEPGLADLIRAAAERLPQRHPAESAYAAQVSALLDGGANRWRAAVAAWRADGQPFPLATALLDYAEAVAADRAAATEAITEAGAITTALGARSLAGAAETLARRLGVGGGSVPAAGTEVLTAREREVLRLVAEGQSNSRIAQRLFISPKTASVHVSRIIAKLEVTNRVEAAAVAHRLGLLDG
ncbi:helix-turn-helix transcriptional regulator [Actinoplanes lobatus]|uniref:DNA-binding CsgD family transcriptional regulator/tetratricopeptide (TPR) repeat protein n=3 Tax=Actinoplanes lobatus TaxID=113568 RepID=A0A7W7HF27_9ACTN|nr:helix-turn-helix transcriptional regulator [Actinoplanes lobatus]MBB4749324.1 DNA-binding CsgD family transcriptional regulator/tetratricopeptide (TPR) repeat protein [Actinoplanes lobatus]